MSSLLTLKNPHATLAALQKRPKDVKQVVISSTHAGEAWDQVAELARKSGVQVSHGSGKPISAEGRQGAAHSIVAEKQGCGLEELFDTEDINPNEPALWLALDCLQDPQNIGAIFRTAAFFGVRGIMITQERTAPMSAVVYDIASGGVDHVPFSIQVNLQRGLEAAQKAGIWILGSSERAKDPLKKIPKDRPWILVLGNEEKGMRRLTEEKCDMICQIPSQGGVTSLNVSVAAGILISHLS